MKLLLAFILFFPFFSNSQTEKSEEIITTIENTDEDGKVIAYSPEFPGGPQAMALFIRDNFKYPEMAREMGQQGTIWVEFVVHSDGILRDIKVVKGVCESLDRESKRIIKAMPKWKPGEQDGKKVNVRYTIPIVAKLGLTKGQQRRKNRKEKRKNR